MTALLIIEHDGKTASSSDKKALGCLLQIDSSIHALVLGYNCDAIVKDVAGWAGVDKVLCCDASCHEHWLAESITEDIMPIVSSYGTIAMAATTTGKNIMPRVAALLGVAQVSDVIGVIEPRVLERPFYAGNAIERIKCLSETLVMTIRTSSFQEPVSEKITTVPIEKVASCAIFRASQWVSEKKTESERPEITVAPVVISGGRGMRSAENFSLLDSLADMMGAAVGASRAAVDSGYAPNDYQVGQTGKIVAPELYIAIGISGAIQHLAGMKDARCIVAINKDPDAPIFQVADYGWVVDLFDAIPALKEALKKV